MFIKLFIAIFCWPEMLVGRFAVKIGRLFSVELREDCEMEVEVINL